MSFGVVTRVPKSVVSFEPSNIRECDVDLIGSLARVANWPAETHGSLLARALYQAKMLRAFESKSGSKLRIIETQKDLQKFLIERRQNPVTVAGFLGCTFTESIDRRTPGSKRRFSAKEIKSVMGDNVIDFLTSSLPALEARFEREKLQLRP